MLIKFIINHYLIHDTPIGELVLNSCSKFLLSIGFKDSHLIQHNTSLFKSKNQVQVLEETAEQLDEYFFHNRTFFTIDYIINTPPFFTRTLKEVTFIEYGKFKSYKQVAKIVKNKKAYRAVANANAHNPLPIIIPCHRVIKSSGELGGYKGGVSRKKYLLNLERKTAKFPN